MKKALAVAGILAQSIIPTASFAGHLEPKETEIRPGGDLAHTNLGGAKLRGANLSNANLSGANLGFADLGRARLKGITARNLRACPSALPGRWACINYSLIQR